MVNRPWQDEDTLRELFIKKDKSTYEIADDLGCKQATVSKWLNRHNIDTGFEHYEKLRDETWLREKYIEESLSQHEIADLLGCGQMTVSRWCQKHGIETRKANFEKYGCHTFDDGYEIFSHRPKDGSGGFVKVHRLIMVAEEGFDAVEGMEVHHKNGIRWDNRPENLELLTPSNHISLHRNSD